MGETAVSCDSPYQPPAHPATLFRMNGYGASRPQNPVFLARAGVVKPAPFQPRQGQGIHQHRQAFAVALRPPCQPVQFAAQHPVGRLLPVGFRPLADLMPFRRQQSPIHRVRIRAIPLRQRQPSQQPPQGRPVAPPHRQHNIPFIDVGMGINIKDQAILGQIRTTVLNDYANDGIKRRYPTATTRTTITPGTSRSPS